MSRFLICGGRNFGIENEEWQFIFDTLSNLINYDKYDHITIITGMARGADTAAYEWAKLMEYPIVEFPAEWTKYGRSAGYIRNKQMLLEGHPEWVIAFPGGKGTEMMCNLAEKAKVKVKRIEYPYKELYL
jgi:hypothetical protein